MHHLEFTRVYDYSGGGESIVVPVILRSGAKQIPVAASVDTGASFCVFGDEIAEALDLDLTGGIRPRTVPSTPMGTKLRSWLLGSEQGLWFTSSAIR